MNLRISFTKAAPAAIMGGSTSKHILQFPDNRAFNWMEATEVMAFVTRYMEYKGWMSPITSKKIEWEIKTRLPFTVKTHHDVMVWLDLNFKR